MKKIIQFIKKDLRQFKYNMINRPANRFWFVISLIVVVVNIWVLYGTN